MALGLNKVVSRLVPLAVALALSASTALGADGAVSGSPSNLTAADAPGGLLEVVLFYGVALLTCVCALGVCISRNVVRMAVWLFGALGSVAVLYFLLAANFIGAIQLMIYVGGTLILLIFGVMLTSKSPWVRFEPKKRELFGAGLVCLALFVSLSAILSGAVWNSAQRTVPGAAVADIGKRLLTTYLVPFEVAGVLLLIVMVGAAHLARQEKN